MTIQLIQVDWRGNDQQGNTSSFNFDDIESINIKKDSDAKASFANIVLKNSIDRFITGFTQPFSKYNADSNQLRFKEGDTVKVYAAEVNDFRAIDTSTNSPDLLISGEIAEVNIKGEAASCKITLKVVDKSYVILSRLYSFAYTATAALTAPEIVQSIARFVTDDVDGDPESYDDSGNLVANGKYSVDARLFSEGTVALPGYLEDTRQDGTAFPATRIAKVAKPAYQWIKELSSLDSTNDFAGSDDVNAPAQDRVMHFYIDEVNKLHWFYPRDTFTTTLNGAINSSVTTITLTSVVGLAKAGPIFIGTERVDYGAISGNNLTNCTRGANNTTAASHSDGDTVRNAISVVEGETTTGYTLQSYNLTLKTFDIVNFVIFTTGLDMLGNGITSYFFDRATKSKSLKDTNKAWNDISAKLILGEITDGRLTKDNATPGSFTFQGNFYKETTGTYSGGAGITPAWTNTAVTTNSGYNNSLRTECIRQGKVQSQKLTNKRGSPRWKGTMNFKLARFTAGEIIEFTSTRAGLNKQTLRIKTVQYNFTKMGAFATLTVEEDEVKLGQ